MYRFGDFYVRSCPRLLPWFGHLTMGWLKVNTDGTANAARPADEISDGIIYGRVDSTYVANLLISPRGVFSYEFLTSSRREIRLRILYRRLRFLQLKSSGGGVFQILRIPKKLVRKYGESLWSSVIPKLPSGLEWKVELTLCDGEVCLQKDRPEFADHFFHRCGYLLVFWYEWNSHFHVIIFDTSAAERDYPTNPTHFDKSYIDEDQLQEPKRGEFKNDDYVKIFDDHNSLSVPHTREKSRLKCPRSHKRMRGSVTLSTLPVVDSNLFLPVKELELQSAGLAMMINAFNAGKLRISICKEKSSGRKVDTQNQKPPSSGVFEGCSKNPFFRMLMGLSRVNNSSLSWEELFRKDAEGSKCKASVGEEMVVDVKLIRHPTNKVHMLSGGWHAFARDNCLRVGDVCRFEMIESNNSVQLQVFITHSVPVPVAFGDQLNEGLPEKAILKDVTGKAWHVGLEKIDNGLCFKTDADTNGIGHGHVKTKQENDKGNVDAQT
ncbi:hypothetical protein FNV43_RR17148 [Rhamnella rubrinervis]|uniref:TF-B3 domain-containing protein n=1 Tax=Rhamnella rubrinervis TaxID=2594499 RepID=A0A8K0E2M9_9ROSA|nr:hypothetical protein FNV43_RR17148 [Rhamnella rubrinervis]